MIFKHLVLAASLSVAPVLLVAQDPEPRTANPRNPTNHEPTNKSGLIPASIAKPLADSWPTFAGVTPAAVQHPSRSIRSNVKNLTLAWMSRVLTGPRGGPPSTSSAAWAGANSRLER